MKKNLTLALNKNISGKLFDIEKFTGALWLGRAQTFSGTHVNR